MQDNTNLMGSFLGDHSFVHNPKTFLYSDVVLFINSRFDCMLYFFFFNGIRINNFFPTSISPKFLRERKNCSH